MQGVLNEVTRTVHKHQMGASDFQTACGAIANVAHDNLRITPIDPEIDTTDASKCGRCFEGAGGY